MRIDRIELTAARLPLVRPFRTSSSRKSTIEHILVHAFDDESGVDGWGEVASPSDPYYCPETTGTCWHILEDFLAPAILGREWGSIDELVGFYARVKGNGFARSGLEMACWDAWGKARGEPLVTMLGGAPGSIASGVSLGIEPEIGPLLEQVERFAAEGYRRVKLKIAPGWDLEPVRAVREAFPDLPLQVDANSAYNLADLDHLRGLDAFGLLLIEQPLAHDDIIDHATLQAAMTTPICLDESIHSAEDARKAIDLGACRVINIKVSRVGGLREAKRIHDHCRTRGVPVWCGGMHEFGVGRAANLAISSLPGFTLPGDISGSDKYYAEDLVVPPLLANLGAIPIPTGSGLGVAPDPDRLARHATRFASLSTTGARR